MSENPAVAAAQNLSSAIQTAIAAAIPLPVSPPTEGAPTENPITQTTTAPPPLPAYALKYAPLLWLHNEEKHWPGDPRTFLNSTHPYTRQGVKVEVPTELVGTLEMLELPQVKNSDVFLVLNEDPRVSSDIASLISKEGIPDDAGKSQSPCWIVAVDKSAIVGEGVVDIFYFFFYPYNLGNEVACSSFGNHVGDWEHAMVRFKDGEPIAVHLSAHANGHSWAWETLEKKDGRAVGYVARGSPHISTAVSL
ncbi:Vacuolar protein sorting-associated protein 62 [Tulasnella sp. 419]|nr:Vacuolar protein sorting-associated protein 62 [Tulasnella sp. 419]